MIKIVSFIVMLLVVGFEVAGQDPLTIENQAHALMEKNKTNDALDTYSKAAQLYWNNQDFENAIRVFELLLELNKKENNQGTILQISNNLGFLYSNIGNYSKSTTAFLLALEISKKQKSQVDIVSSQINIASTLQSAGSFEASFTYLNEALPVASELGDLKILRRTYGLIAQYYEKQSASDKAFEYFEKYAAIDKKIKASEMDAVKREALTKVSAANQEKESTKIKLDKTSSQLKETEDYLKESERLARDRKMQIDLRNLQLREKESQIQYEKKIGRILTVGLLVVGVFFIVVVFLLVDRVRANKLLNAKNKEIENQKNEIENQKEKLVTQNKNITSSITYAHTIQNAALPDIQQIPPFLDAALLYRPKDIVSGDFYWFHHISDDKVIIAVVDCTGHGVPGAFMSLIGVQLLNEIVIGNKIYSPSEILSRLNTMLMKVLKQDKTENEDGMDACVCYIHHLENGQCDLTFSGAKRPIYYYNTSKTTIEAIEGSSFSTGGRYSKKANVAYNSTSIMLEPGDIIALTSDGAIDQPGANRKRFGSSRLMEAIKMGAQNYSDSSGVIDYLTNDYEQYTRGEDQRDDMTILLVKSKM